MDQDVTLFIEDDSFDDMLGQYTILDFSDGFLRIQKDSNNNLTNYASNRVLELDMRDTFSIDSAYFIPGARFFIKRKVNA